MSVSVRGTTYEIRPTFHPYLVRTSTEPHSGRPFCFGHFGRVVICRNWVGEIEQRLWFGLGLRKPRKRRSCVHQEADAPAPINGALHPAIAVLSTGYRPLRSRPRAAGWSAANLDRRIMPAIRRFARARRSSISVSKAGREAPGGNTFGRIAARSHRSPQRGAPRDRGYSLTCKVLRLP